jgi:hypothetical protein
VPHVVVNLDLREHHLDGDVPAERLIAGEKHGCHAAASELTQDLVLGGGLLDAIEEGNGRQNDSDGDGGTVS